MIHCCESKTGTQRHLEGVGNVTVEDLNDLGVLRLLGTRRFEAANWGSSWRNRMGSKPDPMLSAPNPPLLSYFSKDHSDNSWLSCLLLCLWFLILWPSCCFRSSFHMIVLLGWPQRLISDPSRKFWGMFLMARRSTTVDAATTYYCWKVYFQDLQKGFLKVFPQLEESSRRLPFENILFKHHQTTIGKDIQREFYIPYSQSITASKCIIFVYQLRLIVRFNQITFFQHN